MRNSPVCNRQVKNLQFAKSNSFRGGLSIERKNRHSILLRTLRRENIVSPKTLLRFFKQIFQLYSLISVCTKTVDFYEMNYFG